MEGKRRHSRLLVATSLAFFIQACTTANPDYVPPSSGCVLGERACLEGVPVECVPGDGGSRLEPAACPTAATCAAGHCAPPTVAVSCQRELDCGGLTSCMPFVVNERLVTYCAEPEGQLPGGASCSSDSSCRSAHCLSSSSSGKRCYLACHTSSDCPTTAPFCRNFSMTLTGIQGKIQGCSPSE